MPGWYVHLEAAREAVNGLANNPRAAQVFSSGGGKSAQDLVNIATAPENQAYFALGAIGPDLFFLLPDFKPPLGQFVYTLANEVRRIYTWWDDNFLGPWTSAMDPIVANANDQLNGLTGGLLSQLSTISSEAMNFLLDAAVILASRNVDAFSILGSGVIAGYDEKSFFWSDMLHYRRTYRFAVDLWRLAKDVEDGKFQPADGKTKIDPKFADRLRAYALGWMTHLGTDVAGHCFVNEKCGGPFRLHWQRHHLVENHIDGKVYDSKYGSKDRYQMLGAAAMHLWIAFDDGDGRNGTDNHGNTVPILFDDSKRPNYPLGDHTADALGRHRIFDVDSKMPPELASFILAGLHKTYSDLSTSPTDQEAAHPRILAETVKDNQHVDGFPTIDDIEGTYWWLYHYVKYTSTDFWKLRRPDPPQIAIPQPPSPPYAGTDEPIVPSDASTWQKIEDVLLAILAYILYGLEWLTYVVTFLPSLIASAGTLPLREVLYEYIELPLYNLWMALHWYLSMTGYVLPMRDEISDGLVTLGEGVGSDWAGIVWAELQVAAGEIPTRSTITEPSGHDQNHTFPRDTVEDPAPFIQQLLSSLPSPLPSFPHCSADPRGAPSEFLRPWKFPLENNDGSAVPTEQPLTIASPFAANTDATVLINGAPGDNDARHEFEHAHDADDTAQIAQRRFAQQQHLGDPVDYSAYVMAQLTRDNIDVIPNFNLDADRGYAHLCWDWRRSPNVMANPPMFSNNTLNNYRAPAAPGSGWCSDDLLPAPSGVTPPSIHTSSTPVKTRYIDKETK